MALGIYETAVLTDTVRRMPPTPSFLRDRLFSRRLFSNTNKIVFDKERADFRVMPYSAPDVPATIAQKRGFDTDSITAPYLSEKTSFDPQEAMDRSMGEALTGNMSPAAREEAMVAQELVDKRRKLDRGVEKGCAEILKTGQLVVVGENMPTGTVDFKRDAAQTNAAPSVLWTTPATATPHDDLETWAELISDNSGITATEVYMPRGTYSLLRATNDFKELLDRRRVTQTDMDFGPIETQESMPIYVGNYGSFALYVYNFKYEDWQGASQTAFATGDLIMTGGVDGVVHAATILDTDAGFQSMEFFSKSWTDPDPSRRWLLARSSTMPVMYRPNGSLHAKVNP